MRLQAQAMEVQHERAVIGDIQAEELAALQALARALRATENQWRTITKYQTHQTHQTLLSLVVLSAGDLQLCRNGHIRVLFPIVDVRFFFFVVICFASCYWWPECVQDHKQYTGGDTGSVCACVQLMLFGIARDQAHSAHSFGAL